MNASTTHAGAQPVSEPSAETRVPSEVREVSPDDEGRGSWVLGIARDAGDNPVFSLTLVLDRAPGPDDEHIGDFIEQGVLSFDATLGRQTDAVASGGSPFARNAHLRLSFAQPATASEREASATTVLATACGSGVAVRANLHARLERAETLDVLAAIRGEPGGLTLSAEVTSRVEREARSLTLQGSWAVVHDFLAPRVDRGFGFQLPNLRRLFSQMLHEPVLEVAVAGGDGTDWLDCEEEEAIFRAFLRMSPVVLEHATLGLPAGDIGHRWLLKDRPAEGFELTHTEHRPTSGTETERTEAPLHEILAPAFEELELDRFIRLVAPAWDGSGAYEPVARRQRSPRRRSGRGVEGPARPEAVAVVNGRALEIGRLLQPDGTRTVEPRVLAATSLAASGVTVGRASHYMISNGVAAITAHARPRPLPVVDAAKPLWRDRVRANQWWYAQEFQLVRPSPNTPWAESAFLFEYERVGATASGELALRGQVRFHLRKITPQAVTDEFARRERPGADPVAMRDVSVTLGVPFVDERDGRTKSHPLVGTVEDLGDGELRVTVDVAGDWLRLCYGALAQPGFQSRAATVHVAWAFEGYTPVKKDKLTYTLAHLSATTPVVYSATGGGPRPATYFDASSLTYHSTGAEMRLVRESLERVRRPAAMMLARPIKPASVVMRPEVKPLPVADPLPDEMYFLQTHVRQQSLEALFRCNELGHFYREKTSTGSEAIGCRDALRLGEISFRQYREIPELAHARYRVYRSLAQPSRFLVVPRWYRITRYAAAEEDRAWRPVIMLHSSYEEESASGSRFLFHATLEPDIAPWERRVLLAKLAAYAETPILEYPTDIESDASFTWTIASGLAGEVLAQTVPHAIVVSLSTDELGALQLKGVLETSGVVGSARFTLPDGHCVASSLSLQLTQITGTWEHGPLEMRRVDGEVILTNRVERKVVVADLVTWPGPPDGVRVPVETELAPGDSHTVTLADQPAEVYVDYSIPAADPVALEELRSFVEDLHTNVLFVELVNYANHDLAHLEIRARLRGLGEDRSVPMTGVPRVGELSFTLPLTSYLQAHTLEFQVTRVQVSGESSQTEWIEWDLETRGNVISITWDLIA